MRIWKLKGSYTIEASLILPIIIYIVISFLYECFFLHDINVMEAVVRRLVIEERVMKNNMFGEVMPGVQDLEYKTSQEVIEEVILTDHINTDIELSENTVKITCTGEFTVPFRGLLLIHTHDIQIKTVGKLDHCSSFVRKCKVILDTVQTIIH